MSLMTAKTPRNGVTLLAAALLVFAMGPAQSACLCGMAEHSACTSPASRDAASSPEACVCCAPETPEPAGCGPHASPGADIHRCDCAASAPQGDPTVVTAATAPSSPKPIAPMLPAGAPLAPHPDQAAIHRGGAPEDAGSAAPPPPSYLLARAFLI